MLLSAVSVLVVAQSSSEIPEGLMNNPVYRDSVYTSRTAQCAAIRNAYQFTLYRKITTANFKNYKKHTITYPQKYGLLHFDNI